MNEYTSISVSGLSMRKTTQSQMGNEFKQSRWGTHTVWMSSRIRMERRYRTRVTYQSTLSVIRSNENGWRFRMVLLDFILLNSMLPMRARPSIIQYYKGKAMITKIKQLENWQPEQSVFSMQALDQEKLKSLLTSQWGYIEILSL